MNLKEFLLSTLFPSRCLACGHSLKDAQVPQALCDSCRSAVRINQTLFCIICRARLADQKRICHGAAPLRLAAIGNYTDVPLQALVTHLKYRRHTVALHTLVHLIDAYLAPLGDIFSGYAVIAIPLHKSRQRKRGFNQSLLIAEIVAQKLNLPLIENNLTKTRQTLPQAKTKNRKQRIENLAGCFAITDPDTIHGKKILLIDDDCTSGTTLIEAANTLKKAGARSIIGLVVAKTG